MEEPFDILATPASPPKPPETPSFSPTEPQGSMWHWVGGLAGFIVAAAVIGGILFEVPYVALVPGSARDTEPLIEVDGIEAYPSDGELLLTTVRVRQRPNLWEYLWLQTDRDTEIVPEEVILGGRTVDENRDFNLQLMNDSKAVAIAVALEELGYDAIQSDGVLIVELVEGGAAESVLELGDAVVAIDGRPVNHTGDLVDILRDVRPGDEIILTVEPISDFAPASPDDGAPDDGETDPSSDASSDPAANAGEADDGVTAAPVRTRLEIPVVVGAKDDDPEAAFLGVGPTDRVDLRNDFDFVVDIDSGAVGGPSAGLAFTLAVLDQLTEGELTGGATVAVTGTIDVSGRVGTVGGVVQKTAAVRDLGADVFLVPSGLDPEELELIVDRAGDNLRIIPVGTLEEALEALAGLGGEVAAVEEFAAANLS